MSEGKHPTVFLSNPVYGRVPIDCLMAPIVKRLWQLDVNTHCCCQGLNVGSWGLVESKSTKDIQFADYAQIGFPDRSSFRRFLGLMAQDSPAALKTRRGWLFESSPLNRQNFTSSELLAFKSLGEDHYYFAYFPPRDINWIREKLS